MKRFLVGAMASALLFAGLVPVASAAPTINVFQGSGSATALDLTIPGLAGVAASTSNATLIDVAKKFPGVTVGHTFSSFTVDAIKKAASANGGAAPSCDLLTRDVDPLKVCSSSSDANPGNSEISSAPTGISGDDKATCTDVKLPSAEVGLVNLSTACGKSFSRIVDGAPQAVNEAAVAGVNVSLDLSPLGLELENNKDAVVGTVRDFVVGAVNGVTPQNDLTDQAKEDLAEGLHAFLTSVAQGNKLADIKVGTSSVTVEPAGNLTTITSKAAGATVELLGVTLQGKTDYLITIEVSHALATATWDKVAGVANANATKALATIRIKDLAALCENSSLALPCENDYIKVVVNAVDVNNLLAPLNSIDLLHTTVNVGPDTKSQTGKSVVATASGVEIRALKGLGQSAEGKRDGGLDLRVATAGVTLAGDVAEQQAAPLPLTGGPTPLYIGGAILMAAAAFGLYRWSLKLRATA